MLACCMLALFCAVWAHALRDDSRGLGHTWAGTPAASWTGQGGHPSRSGQFLLPLLPSPLTPGQTTGVLGKSHGSPAVSLDNDVYFVAWNTTAPFLYSWRASGVLDAVQLPNLGSDIISDSFDAVLLGDGLVFVTIAYYNASLSESAYAGCYFTNNLTAAWEQQPIAMADAAAFVATPAGPMLLMLHSKKRSVQVRDAYTGKESTPLSFTGPCDWRSSLATSDDSRTVYVLCIDKTFGSNKVYAFSIESGEQLFGVVYKGLNPYWPPALSSWTSAGLVLGFTNRFVYAINPGNGSQAWRLPTPTLYVDILLAYAHGSTVDGLPLLYVLGQSSATTSPPTYLLAYNLTDGRPVLAAPPAYMTIRVDQFSGTLILAPDGVTVVVNGWNPNSKTAAAALTQMKLDVDKGTWTYVWTSFWPDDYSGRLTLFSAPRTNGSIVVSGWNGVYQYD